MKNLFKGTSLLLITFQLFIFQSCTKEKNKDQESKGHWQKVVELAAFGRERAFSFVIGNNLYVGMGMGHANGFNDTIISYSDFHEYNTISNTWTRKADVPSIGALNAVGFAINGKGYMAAGWNKCPENSGCGAYVVSPDFWEFDPLSNTWKKVATLDRIVSLNRRDFVAFVADDKAYFIVGSEMWQFNPSDYSLTPKAPCPLGMAAASFFTLDNKAYILPGDVPDYPGSNSQTFFEYNPSNDKWTRKADFAGPALMDGIGFGIKGKGYIGCGVVNEKTSDIAWEMKDIRKFWQYDPASDKWTQIADYPGKGSINLLAAVVNDKAFVGTGNSLIEEPNINHFPPFKDFWQFTP